MLAVVKDRESDNRVGSIFGYDAEARFEFSDACGPLRAGDISLLPVSGFISRRLWLG